MDRGVMRAIVHGVTKSWTRLSNYAHICKKKKKSFTIVILEDRIEVHLLSDTPYNLYDYLLLIFNLKEHE